MGNKCEKCSECTDVHEHVYDMVIGDTGQLLPFQNRLKKFSDLDRYD